MKIKFLLIPIIALAFVVAGIAAGLIEKQSRAVATWPDAAFKSEGK